MKLVSFTNPIGKKVYFGGGWIIRPADSGYAPNARTLVIYNGVLQAVLETVDEVVAAVEASGQ
jgi:hypothetical protein